MSASLQTRSMTAGVPRSSSLRRSEIGEWHIARRSLTTRPENDANYNKTNGEMQGTAPGLTEREDSTLICLVEHEVEPDLGKSTGYSALGRTVIEGFFKNMRSLRQCGAILRIAIIVAGRYFFKPSVSGDVKTLEHLS